MEVNITSITSLMEAVRSAVLAVGLGIVCFFSRYRCQIDTFKMVPVPKWCLKRYLYIKINYQLIIEVAICTKHMGPVSQTGL